MITPAYLVEALKYKGLKETTGKNDSPILDKWWDSFNWGWLHNQAWCGLFIARCMKDTGYPVPAFAYRAKSWLDWGVAVSNPFYGAIAVMKREGGYHVFIVTGITSDDRIAGFGGNQSNSVSFSSFNRKDILGYRVPVGFNVAYNALTKRLTDIPHSMSEA